MSVAKHRQPPPTDITSTKSDGLTSAAFFFCLPVPLISHGRKVIIFIVISSEEVAQKRLY